MTNVLLIENEKQVIQSIAEISNELKLNLLQALDFDEAITLAKTNSISIAIIGVDDSNLETGFQIANELKNYFNNNIYVIIASNITVFKGYAIDPTSYENYFIPDEIVEKQLLDLNYIRRLNEIFVIPCKGS